VKEGYVESLKKGPLFWIDSADSQPCIGTAGMAQWKLEAKGKLFHSGLPHKGINAIEFAMDAISHIQKRFFIDFPRHPREGDYNYATQSTLKPTQIRCSPGAINQLPPDCIVEGDIRLTPFYDIFQVKDAVQSYVDEINADPTLIENPAHRGPHSKYSLLPNEDKAGVLQLSWNGEGENGIACDLTSIGFKVITEATLSVLGDAKPFSIGGSLPLVRELQEQGYDVQIAGYGHSSKFVFSFFNGN